MKRTLSRYLLPVTCYLLLVNISFAQIKVFDTPNPGLNFWVMAGKFSDIANTIIPFLIGLALLAIIWGIFKYVMGAGDSEKIADGRKMMIYGVIAMFLMLSFWGFVMMITNTFFN